VAFEWAMNRFDDCLSNHKLCKPPETTPLPTRILDLSGDDFIKLYVTKSENERYACLSHSWGGIVPCQTLKENCDKHQERINISDLPATFRDVVGYVRRLGIRFLWIDSLCIVQDDINDWRRECIKMYSVYRNAALTIAATKSRDSRAGLFTAAEKQFMGQRVGDIDVTFNEGRTDECTEKCDLFLRQTLYETHDAFHRHIPGEQDNLPLLGRGWVFQERLLSPRVLHFGSQELIWECAESSFCECQDVSDSASTLKKEHSEEIPSEKWWQELVNDYSALNLTFPSDRLPALSGIAKEYYKHRPSDRYIAGMWESSIYKDMLWRVKERNRNEKLIEWRAPSWSWVSVDSIISYETNGFFGEGERLCEILSIESTTVDGDPTSGLKSASMIISGCFTTSVIQHIPPTDGSEWWSCHLTTDGRSVECFLDHHLHLPGPNNIPNGTTVYCFPLCHNFNGTYSLVLLPSNSDEDIFERVGLLVEYGVQRDKSFCIIGGDKRVIEIR
jgi:Heterokaryon incompatibility protein (HET)